MVNASFMRNRTVKKPSYQAISPCPVVGDCIESFFVLFHRIGQRQVVRTIEKAGNHWIIE
ncbi:unnamed protein product [Larinioides sclopetarius]|uniref:Uncharacterized protein n=1 Tax=Larinioides sclopetarius TaxID=280406 RepID=A0AAV2AJ47_9ARAC